ncbi:MAG: hypothetical protein AB7U20_26000 [Planctomycetaceae bacterium]
MPSHSSLLIGLSIIVSLADLPLRADDPFLSGGSRFVAASMPDQVGVANDPAALDPYANAASPGLADPKAWFSDSGCCDSSACDGSVPCQSRRCASPWKVRFIPNGWLYEVQGSTTIRGVSSPVDVSYRDTLRFLTHDVDFVFSAKLEVEKDQYGLIVNGFYVKADLGNRIGNLNFDSSFNMTILDMAATYNLLADADSIPYVSRFDALAGIRVWTLSGGVTATGPLNNSVTVAGVRDWVDPFLGGRVIMPLAEGTEAQIRGDIGGFDWGEASRFTWQLEALIALQCSESCSLRAGYRILDVNNHQGSGANAFAFDVQFRGPVAELVFAF